MPSRRTIILASAASIGSRLTVVGLCAPSMLSAQEPGPGSTASAALPELAAELPAMQWAGNARMRYFTFNVYDASLWVAPGFSASRYAQSVFALQLRYLRNLDGHAIAQRSLAEMRKAASLTPAQEQRWLAAMQDAFPDVKTGDRLTGLHQPGVGARFWLNGAIRAVVADPEFSRAFFGIWLSESTSEPRLRAALLAHATP